MDYGSPFYILMLLLLFLIGFLLWFFIKKLNIKLQRLIVLVIMLINVAQHLFKWAIYPMYEGQGFTALSTAYNMCALLILLMPIAYISKSDSFKDFVFLAGAFAGFITNVIPYWHIGVPVSELGWEYARFYICHALLFFSGMLPLLLSHHKLSYKRFYTVGAYFLLSLMIILVNDVIFICLGVYFEHTPNELYESLYVLNPCWSMHPPAEFPIVEKAVSLFSPDILLGKGDAGYPAPILWYAIPLYIGFSVLSFIVMAMLDRKNFTRDLKALCSRLKQK